MKIRASQSAVYLLSGCDRMGSNWQLCALLCKNMVINSDKFVKIANPLLITYRKSHDRRQEVEKREIEGQHQSTAGSELKSCVFSVF